MALGGSSGAHLPSPLVASYGMPEPARLETIASLGIFSGYDPRASSTPSAHFGFGRQSTLDFQFERGRPAQPASRMAV